MASANQRPSGLAKGDPHEFTAPDGPGSVSGAPNLPAGFTDTFTSRYIDTGELRLHAVIGGDGPPLLLVHGWPENWYAWRLRDAGAGPGLQVIAVDQRGIGLSDKPADGYDTGTLADDLVALMDALGHERFAVVGHDTGFAISYALAADHPDRVDRVALAEIPGPPGATPPPPLFVPAPLNDRLWHIPFNRVDKLPEQLVTGREDDLLRLRVRDPGRRRCPTTSIAYYVGRCSPTPTPCAAASGSTERSTPPSHRTSSARREPLDHAGPGDRRRDELRRARRRRDAASSPTTCRASSSPAPATGSPRRPPRDAGGPDVRSWPPSDRQPAGAARHR